MKAMSLSPACSYFAGSRHPDMLISLLILESAVENGL
jgi:hypothetical protein